MPEPIPVTLSEQQAPAVALPAAIGALLASGEPLYIERGFALQAFYGLMADYEARANGADYRDLGVSQRRHEAMAGVLMASNNYSFLRDPGLIRNAALTPPGSFAMLQLTGVMTAEGSASTPGAEQMASDLRAAYSNPNLDGILIRGNSGGGGADAMRVLQTALSERNKPVLFWASLAASAAYGVAAATDEVIAAFSAAKFGSIGAVIPVNKTLLKLFDDNFVELVGRNSPLKNEPIRNAQRGDYALLQAIADEETDLFHDNIRSLRALTDSSRTRMADTLSGAVFTTAEAMRRGLVDNVGNLQFALKRARVWADKYKRA
jgi:ClpP class serine protease